jgi:hypothetical protein
VRAAPWDEQLGSLRPQTGRRSRLGEPPAWPTRLDDSTARPPARTWNFDSDAAGKPPAGFSFGRTGKGAEGQWVVRAESDAPSAAGAFVAFYLARLPFIAVLLGCGFAFIAWRKMRTGLRATSMLALLALPGRAEAAEAAAKRIFDISWFFLEVGLMFSVSIPL